MTMYINKENYLINTNVTQQFLSFFFYKGKSSCPHLLMKNWPKATMSFPTLHTSLTSLCRQILSFLPFYLFWVDAFNRQPMLGDGRSKNSPGDMGYEGEDNHIKYPHERFSPHGCWTYPCLSMPINRCCK